MRPEQVKRFIDVIVKLGYNTLQLYTEDTYEVEDEPYFGFMRGAYTGKELRDIDAYALSKGVELIPCIQTLAHFSAPSKNEPLKHLFDVNDILLCEEESTYQFIEKCFQSIAKNFSSRLVNIGMDEAHMLGLGKYLKKHGYTEKFDILTRHLSRVAQIAEKYGFTPHMWSDMFFRPINDGAYWGRNLHVPQSVCKQIPKDVELAYWDYYTQDQAQYDDMISAHLEMNRRVWFVGGAWSYCGFAPYNRYTLDSMKPAMHSVRQYGVQDVLITMWGNGGKECSFFALLPALYTIRQYADGNFDDEKIKRDFEKIIGIGYDDFCLLDIPNESVGPKFNGSGWPENPSKTLLYQDVFQGIYDGDMQSRKPIDYTSHVQKLYSLVPKMGEYAYIPQMLADLCSVLECKADLGLKTRKAYRDKNKKELSALISLYTQAIERLDILHESFYALWHKENKPFGWEVHDLRLGGLQRRLKTCIKKIEAYLLGEENALEELDSALLPWGHIDVLENTYANIVTRGIL